MRARDCARLLESPEPPFGNYFVSTYPPFSCWTEQAVREYRRFLDAPRPDPEQVPLGLYVHVPFCIERCQYCYYLSTDQELQEMEPYLLALGDELRGYARSEAFADRTLSFVYFGGGTPSILSPSRVAQLMRTLQGAFPWTGALEISFECAPRSVTREKIEKLRDAGVTRISLGVQQLDDGVLAANGRVHLVDDVERAWSAIRSAGFDVVNLDLMTGLVGETDETYHRSLDRVLDWQPESVTIYQLEIPLNTSLYRSISDGSFASTPASWDQKRARLRDGLARLESQGYSVRSAYTAVRDPERHGFVYQDEQYRGADLLGIGASAFSYVAGIHQQNQASLQSYLRSSSAGELPLWRAWVLSDSERLVRELVLQLKLGKARRDYFHMKFGVDVLERFAEPLAYLESKGWLRTAEQGIEMTREGLLRADRIITAFYLPEHRGLRYS